MKTGTIIKNLREERGITQVEFAKAIHVSSGAVSMYETNQRIPRKSTLEEIADYFNVDINYLFGYTDLSTYILPPDIGDALKNIQGRPALADFIKEVSKMSDEDIEKITVIVKMWRDK